MGRFILRRVLQGVVVIVVVSLVVFVVTRMVGDPARNMLSLDATEEQVAALREDLGTDRPIGSQFLEYVQGVVRLDFGESLWQGRPTLEIVWEKLPNTLLLSIVSMALALVIAIPLGILAAVRPNSALDKAAVTTSLIGVSMPQFWFGLLLILLFSVELGWLPTSGHGGIRFMVLPATTLALRIAGSLALFVRSAMINELNQQYVKVLRAKGMPFRRTVGTHALRNASVPVTVVGGWELTQMMAGYSVIVETVFGWPGIGLTAIQAIERHDLFLLQTIVLVVALIVVVMNVVLDVVSAWIDPRIEIS